MHRVRDGTDRRSAPADPGQSIALQGPPTNNQPPPTPILTALKPTTNVQPHTHRPRPADFPSLTPATLEWQEHREDRPHDWCIPAVAQGNGHVMHAVDVMRVHWPELLMRVLSRVLSQRGRTKKHPGGGLVSVRPFRAHGNSNATYSFFCGGFARAIKSFCVVKYTET